MEILRLGHKALSKLLPSFRAKNGVAGPVATFILMLAASLALTLFLSTTAMAQRGAEINKLKAAFLYQFANFVEWPEETFENDGDPFIICIVGNENLKETLEKAVKGRTINERVIEVKSATVAAMPVCHIAFVDESQNRNAGEVIEILRDRPVLTVGDSKDFTRLGGVIRLFERSSRLRLEINVDAAARAKLKISSKLLSLADIVHDEL